MVAYTLALPNFNLVYMYCKMPGHWPRRLALFAYAGLMPDDIRQPNILFFIWGPTCISLFTIVPHEYQTI